MFLTGCNSSFLPEKDDLKDDTTASSQQNQNETISANSSEQSSLGSQMESNALKEDEITSSSEKDEPKSQSQDKPSSSSSKPSSSQPSSSQPSSSSSKPSLSSDKPTSSTPSSIVKPSLPQEGKFYEITNLASSKKLDVYGGGSANNTNITVYNKNSSNAQIFYVTRYGDTYVITAYCAEGSAVNIYGNNPDNNSNVCLWTKTGHSTQAWYLEYSSAVNGYILKSAYDKNLVLTAVGTDVGSNVCVQTYSSGSKYQGWTFDEVKVSQSSTGVVSPVTNRRITSNFQPYYRQDYSNAYSHVGIDYVSNSGNLDVKAFYPGIVTKTGYNGSVGYYIEIKHHYNGKTVYSYYFHLAKNTTLVSSGANVTAGQKIATMGTTGDSTGVHLHFQLTSASVVNSNGTIHTPTNNNSYKSWSITQQSAVVSFTSSRGIVFYNPEIALSGGLSAIM